MKKHAKKIIVALLVAAMLVPTVGMIFGSAVDNSFPVELAYNNLFVFEKWANNELSTTIMPNDDPDNPYGKVETNMADGSITITSYRKAPEGYGGIFTAYGGDTKESLNNGNYYSIDVKPNTTYNFSYVLESSNLSAFIPYVFYFDDKNLALPTPGTEPDEDGKYAPLNSLGVAANLNGQNIWSFTTPDNTDRIQIRFTVGDSANGATSTATVKDIIIYEADLTSPENMFDFNAWASNDDSNAASTLYGAGSHSVNSANQSISFEATGNYSTNFTLGSKDTKDDEGNITNSYYTIAVEPYTTYSVSYILENSTLNGTGVAIAFHDKNGDAIADGTAPYYAINLYAYNLNGYNYHTINTPATAAYMQIAFCTFHSGDPASGTMRDIKVCDPGSLFCLGEWAANEKSNSLQSGSADTLNADPKANTVTFKSDVFTAHFTKYDLTSDADFYTADVEPNTSYTYHYNVNIVGGAPSGIYFEPWFVEFDESGKPTLSTIYHNKTGSVFGDNNYTFTTHPNTDRIMIVFSFHHTIDDGNEWTWTIKDMTLCPTKTFEDITGAPHREVFTYDHSKADTNFYGDLPTATAPEGYVFGGWYTADGERITPETKIKYSSFSVFSKYERAVDKLEIASLPNNTIYTVGEKLNTAGLSLKATIGEASFIIDSDIYCTPVYLDEAGEQTITAHYGGKTDTFKVTVLDHETSSIIVNGVAMDNVKETNGKYTLNYSTSAFNRFELAYSTNAYVRGLMTFESGITEEFFLEPSDNGKFYSYIDKFVYGNTHTQIVSVEFTCLDNENGDFKLKSIATSKRDDYGNTVYFANDEYELGVSLEYGGVISELYVLNEDIEARVYKDPDKYLADDKGNIKDRSFVDYKNKLDEKFEGQTPSDTSNKVNLINTLDRGRYLQQSYYGTNEKPYIQGEFNDSPWKYNPVQGGNVGEEPSKLVDYEITDNYIYVKARPMEWEKWSDDHVDVCEHKEPVYDENDQLVLDEHGEIVYKKAHDQKLYGNDVISDTYVEAWYYFEDGMIKVTNRKVDYSGLPEAYTEQELPALYLVEPLNNFVYNNVSADAAWAESFDNLTTIDGELSPEFWGIVPEYSKKYYPTPDPDEDKNKLYDGYVKPAEKWAAFTASEDPDSFGVGIYSPDATKFYYGVMPQIYATPTNSAKNYRHAETADPSPEMPTAYIAPLERKTFKSYDPTEYTYYLTTGTTEDIYTDFRSLGDKVAEIELAKTKIAVPETVYMNPANNQNGQYYVNNIMDKADFYNIETVAEREETDMYFGLHVKDAVSFTVNVSNVTDPSNDIILGNADGTGNLEGQTFSFDSNEIDSVIKDGAWSLRTTNAITQSKTETAKWEITVTFSNGTTETFTAYTVLYAPMYTVGAVAEARRSGTYNNEIATWITGATSVKTDADGKHEITPLGRENPHGDKRNSGYFTMDPLVYPDTLPTGGSSESSTDYISGVGTPDYSNLDKGDENAYVMQAATNGSDDTMPKSYLGLLMVDKSRYSNTNEIPNLRIGYDVLRVNGNNRDSLQRYTTWYNLSAADSYVAGGQTVAPSGWPKFSSYYDFRDYHTAPYRETLIPDYSVSTIDGMYLSAVSQGTADYLNAHTYSTPITSVLCSVTDKSSLRDAVLDAYAKSDSEHQSDNLAVSLEKAATVLGDPSATQAEIDTARKEINESLTVEHYALRYDNLFSAYEFSLKTDGMKMVKAFETEQNNDEAVLDEKATVRYKDSKIIINSNGTTAKDHNVYTFFGPLDNYYTIPVKPNTEYVFEYDVVSSGGSQAHVFVYDDNDNETTISSGSVKATVGTASPDPATITGNENFIGAYTFDSTKTHVVIRFTTSANVAEVAIRFGNIVNASNTSTFSNIRFVEAKHFSEEIVYSTSKPIYTEALYEENTAYGELLSPTRIGFTFLKWLHDDESTEVQTTDHITGHTTIYSDWYEHSYKIAYKANGGTGSETTTGLNKYTTNVTLQNGGFTKTDYVLAGWSTDADATYPDYKLGQSVSRLTPTDNATVTLYAVWVLDTVNVTFDNLIDINEWLELTPSNAKITDATGTSFTLKSTNPNGGEGTFTSPFFPVEPGKDYKIEIDFTGEPWDVYIFFCDKDGNWVDFKDGETNRYSSYTTWDTVFTAPDKDSVVKAQIRVDANEPANPVTFNNIRVYEDTGISVSPVNKQVLSNAEFGTLPVPTKEGYVFAGWYDGDTLVTSTAKATSNSTYYLKSKWVKPEELLTKDNVVVDFSSAINIAPLNNDTVLIDVAEATESSYKIVGISEDGTSYSSTANGEYGTFTVAENNILYTPSKVVNDVETIYYQTSITIGDVTTTLNDTITVAPASNVLYEDNFFVTNASTGLDWSASTVTATNQDASTEKDVYGFDSSYNEFSNYSSSSARSVTVDATNKRSKILAFTFEGTGFDLNSVCGYNTGVLVVSVKNNSTGKVIKSYLVDTYYGDATYATSKTLYQVPVINDNSFDHGNYTVQIVASYLPTMSGALDADKVKTQAVDNVDGMVANTAPVADNAALRNALAEIGMEYVLDAETVDVIWFDDNSVLNGGMGVNTIEEGTVKTATLTGLLNVVDSVRVYNPIENGNDYYIDSEKNAQYYNVMDNLVNGGEDGIFSADNIFSYIAGKDKETITVDNYNAIGPKDELYLAKNTDAVAFTIDGFNKETTRVMISLRAAHGTPEVKIGNKTITINSKTEMYYDITDYIDGETVTIQNNTLNTLLSVGSVKTTSALDTFVLVPTELDLATASFMMMTPVEPDEPDIPADPEVPTDPVEPEDPTDPNEPEDPTDPNEPEDPTGSEEPSDGDNTSECWLIRFFNWVIDTFMQVFNFIKSVLGF